MGIIPFSPGNACRLRYFAGFTLCLLLFLSFGLRAQNGNNNQLSGEKYEPHIGQLVSFLGKIYNTLGSQTATIKEKNTVLENSYLKVFKDQRVQIEDDLVEGRSAVVIKDVRSYLQDIDIFFRSAQFDLNVLETSIVTNVHNRSFFKVVVNQNLQGINSKGQIVNMDRVRFIEVEMDEATEELKISSIYSKLVNKHQSLESWWRGLSFEWKVIFQRAINTELKPDNEQLKKIISLERLDVSYNKYITGIEPLAMVSNLREIDLSNTDVSDITPLRNHQNLEVLNISKTKVKDVNALQFTDNLRYLFMDYTPVNDLSPLYQLAKLEKVLCEGTDITGKQATELASRNPNNCEVIIESDASMRWWNTIPMVWREKFMLELAFTGSNVGSNELGKIESLTRLSLQRNKNIKGLKPLRFLKELQYLDCEGTGINNLDGIAELTKLVELDISDTEVTDIKPLLILKNLKKVRFNNLKITPEDIEAFQKERPDIKLMNRYTMLVSWWIRIPENWQQVFIAHVGYEGPLPVPPEILYDIVKLEQLDISGRQDLADLAPLYMLSELKELNIDSNMSITSLDPIDSLYNLEKLICSNNPIADLTPLSQLHNLKYLDIKNTPVVSVDPLENLKKLEELDISATKITNLRGLRALRNLKKLKCYNTNISSINPLITLVKLQSLLCYNTRLTKKKVDDFKKIKPQCHVIFY